MTGPGPELAQIMLTTAEAARLMGITRWGLTKNLHDCSFVEQPGAAPGGKVYRIALSSLPVDAQARYWASRDEAAAVEAGGLAADGTSLAEVVDRYGDRAVAEALRRERVVRQAISYDATRTKVRRLQEIAAQAEISVSTLYRWINDYHEQGFLGLLNEPRERPGAGAKKLSEEACQYIRRQYLQPNKPTVQMVYELYLDKARAAGWQTCSYSTIDRFIKEIPYTEEIMGREGLESWRKKAMPKTVRARVAVANAIYVGDHHEFDFWIAHAGRIVRPWLTAWHDMCSNAIMGWTISLQPSSQTIALALRHAILPKEDGSPLQGLPAECYIDNGRDYRSEHLDAVFSALKIDVTYCEAYTPWSKPVERTFGTVCTRFSRQAPGYCGNKPENRPEGADKQAQALAAAGKLWTMQDLRQQFSRWLAEDYHIRPHSRLKASPLEMWQRAPKARLEMPDPRALDVCLMKVESARVYTVGIQRFNHFFWADELAGLVGEDVSIRFDPDRIGELVVFRRDRFLCVARSRELMEMGATGDTLKEWRKVQQREKKRVQALVRGDVPQSLEEVAAAQRDAGPRVATAGNQRVAPKVAALTGFERAGRVLAEGQAPGSSTPGPTRRDTARDLADDLLLAYADVAIQGGGR